MFLFWYFSFFAESSSSGYDSTDLSDTESSASSSSEDSYDSARHEPRDKFVSRARDSYVNLLPASPSDEEVMNFQSPTSLCENLKLILAVPDLCDVTFLVGPREIPVHGVRAIMGTRSRWVVFVLHQFGLRKKECMYCCWKSKDTSVVVNLYKKHVSIASWYSDFWRQYKYETIMNIFSFYRVLYQLILKHMSIQPKKIKKNKKSTGKKSVGISRSLSERLVIPVKKYDSEVFRMLIQFVHCGSVNITEDTVAGKFIFKQYFRI